MLLKAPVTDRTHSMLFRFFTWFLSILLVANALPSINSQISVNLRIEGKDKTIYEGFIRTKGHNVTTRSGGNHHCDGTNNHANSRPGPTCTSALDDAARQSGFHFDGTFDGTFDDFFITSIGSDTETATEFWGILVNFQFTPVGGCQEEVKVGEDILWAFDAFNAVNFLKLSGPETARRNHPVVLTVTDGQTGKPVAGAEVNGHTSGADGKVSVTFAKTGVNGVKAEKPSTIRSNRVTILVLP